MIVVLLVFPRTISNCGGFAGLAVVGQRSEYGLNAIR
jgi:hypothetical protein